MSERFNPFLPGEARRQLVRIGRDTALYAPGIFAGFWLHDHYGLGIGLQILVLLTWLAFIQLVVLLWRQRRR